MNKNIYTKSMLRQPVKTALLALLLAVAAFFFVMRSLEYIALIENINEIGKNFRAIGILNFARDPTYGDARSGADIVSNSRYVAFEDRRRTIEAVLMDMPSTDTRGNAMRVALPDVRQSDAFFYGTVVDISPGHDAPYMVLSVEVDKVLVGFPEHVKAGQTVALNYFFDENEKETCSSPIDEMTIGQRYFLRGSYYHHWFMMEWASPMVFGEMLVMHPLSEVTFGNWGFRILDKAGLWYVPVTSGEEADASGRGLDGLDEELRWLRHNQSAITLQTTADMSAMPIMLQNRQVKGELVGGRWLDHEDYLEKRPVIAVHERFARLRGLELGDIVSIGIPQDQRLSGNASIGSDGFLVIGITGAADVPYAYVLDLEIVGIFNFTGSNDFLSTSYATTFVYVPDSVLPPDVSLLSAELMIDNETGTVLRTIEEGFISHSWYSFVLRDPRNEDAFLMENSDALEALGYTVRIISGNALDFWGSAEPIIQSATFNIIVSSAVLLFVLALVSLFYIQQRQRDFAIMRALGCPAQKAYGRLFATLSSFSLPAIILGSIGGWVFSAGRISETLGLLGEIVDDISAGHGLSSILLIPLAATVFACLLILTLIGATVMGRRPVLDMFQGGRRGKI